MPSEDQARTAACRGYILDVGHDDVDEAKELVTQAGPGFDSEGGANIKLTPVRAAAVVAGRTAGLSKKDFNRFRAVAEAVDGVGAGAVVLDDGTSTLSVAKIAPFQRAATAVHKLCY